MRLIKLLGAGFAVSLLFNMAAVSSSAAGQTYYLGDVDKNGIVEASDARTILRASVDLEKLDGMNNGRVADIASDTPTQAQLADVDGDGTVSSADARSSLRISVKLDPPAPFTIAKLTTEQKLQAMIDNGEIDDLDMEDAKIYAKNSNVICEMSLDVPDTMIPFVKMMIEPEMKKLDTSEMTDMMKMLRTKTGDNNVGVILLLKTTSGKTIYEKRFS